MLRSHISKILIKKGLRPLSIISDKSLIYDKSNIGHGLQVCPIQKMKNINRRKLLFKCNSVVDHECTIGNEFVSRVQKKISWKGQN